MSLYIAVVVQRQHDRLITYRRGSIPTTATTSYNRKLYVALSCPTLVEKFVIQVGKQPIKCDRVWTHIRVNACVYARLVQLVERRTCNA